MTLELLDNSPTPGQVAEIATLTQPITTTPAALTAESYTVSKAAPTRLQSAVPAQFRVIIDGEIMIVTAKSDGSSPWTFARAADGTTAATHASGTKIYHVPTAAGLDGRYLRPDDNLALLATAGNFDTARANLRVPVLRHAQCVATSNQALSGALPTIDGYAVQDGDRVLLTGQTTASQNGPWVAHTAGWVRPDDFPTTAVLTSRSMKVTGGTAYGSTDWVLASTASVTVDTTAQTWKPVQVPSSALPAVVVKATSGPTPLVNALPGANGLIPVIDVHSAPYNAKGDAIHVSDGAMTASSATLACATSTPFTSTAVDAGKKIVVMGAGPAGAALSTTIQSVTDSGHAVLAAAANTTVATKAVQFGTDDTAAINAALLAAFALVSGDPLFANAGAEVVLRNRNYLITSAIRHKTNVTLRGWGPGATGIHQQFANSFSMWTPDTLDENTWWVRDLRFDGHGAQQTATATGILFQRTNTGQLVTPPYTPSFFDPAPWYGAQSGLGGDLKGMVNVAVWHINGDGFGGLDYAVYLDRLFVMDTWGHNFNCSLADSNIVSSQFGGAGQSNIFEQGSNNRWTNIKTYQSSIRVAGSGSVLVQGSKALMDGLEIQQVPDIGLRLNGVENKINGRVDGCGTDAVYLDNGASSNEVDLVVNAFVGIQPQTLINGAGYAGNNRIRINGTDWTSGSPIKGNLIGNEISINGSHTGRARFSKIEVAGHADTHGQGLGSASDSFVQRIGRLHGTTPTDYSEASTTSSGPVYSVVASGGPGNGSIVTDVLAQVTRPDRTYPFLSRSGLVVIDGARWDYTNYVNTYATTQQNNQIKGGMRAVISRFLSCAVYEGTDAALTFTGSWAASASDPGFSGGETRAAGANGDTVTLTVPANWPGGYAVLGVKCVTGGNGAVFTVSGAGITTTAFDSRGFAQAGTGTCVGTVRIPVSASAAGQTLTVTVSSFTSAAAFDYVAFEMPIGGTGGGGQWTPSHPGPNAGAKLTASPPVILVKGEQHLPTYPTGTPFPMSNTSIDNVNGCIQALVQEYQSQRVLLVDTGVALSTYGSPEPTLYQANGQWLNANGHARLAGTLAQYVAAAGVTSSDYASLV